MLDTFDVFRVFLPRLPCEDQGRETDGGDRPSHPLHYMHTPPDVHLDFDHPLRRSLRLGGELLQFNEHHQSHLRQVLLPVLVRVLQAQVDLSYTIADIPTEEEMNKRARVCSLYCRCIQSTCALLSYLGRGSSAEFASSGVIPALVECMKRLPSTAGATAPAAELWDLMGITPPVNVQNPLHMTMFETYRRRCQDVGNCLGFGLDTLLYLCCDNVELQQQAEAARACQVPGWIDVWCQRAALGRFGRLSCLPNVNGRACWSNVEPPNSAAIDSIMHLLGKLCSCDCERATAVHRAQEVLSDEEVGRANVGGYPYRRI